MPLPPIRSRSDAPVEAKQQTAEEVLVLASSKEVYQQLYLC
jgi:hypothetical protein